MNERQLGDALKRIASEHIGEIDMWSEIQAQVGARQRGFGWYALRFAAAIMLLILALATATVGYALIQRYFDPGTQNVIDQDLVVTLDVTAVVPTPVPTPIVTEEASAPEATTVPGEPIGESADLGNVTLTLDWAYADPLRILIGYTLSVPEGQTVPYYLEMPTLSYADGSFFNHSIGPLGAPQDEPNVRHTVVSMEHREPVPADGVYDLILNLELSPMPDPGSGIDPFSQPGTTLTFNLSLPVQSVQTIEMDQTVTVNGTAIRLQKVEVSPAAVRISYCYGFPADPPTIDWLPRSTVTLDGRETLPMGGGITVDKSEITANDTERCWYEDFSANYREGDGLLRFSVDALVHYAPEDYDSDRFARAEERLAAQGIVVEFQIGDHGWGFETVSAPDGMIESEIGMRVVDALSDIAEGPWVFEIQLP